MQRCLREYISKEYISFFQVSSVITMSKKELGTITIPAVLRGIR